MDRMNHIYTQRLFGMQDRSHEYHVQHVLLMLLMPCHVLDDHMNRHVTVVVVVLTLVDYTDYDYYNMIVRTLLLHTLLLHTLNTLLVDADADADAADAADVDAADADADCMYSLHDNRGYYNHMK
jgi:hypothetical protein